MIFWWNFQFFFLRNRSSRGRWFHRKNQRWQEKDSRIPTQQTWKTLQAINRCCSQQVSSIFHMNTNIDDVIFMTHDKILNSAKNSLNAKNSVHGKIEQTIFWTILILWEMFARIKQLLAVLEDTKMIRHLIWVIRNDSFFWFCMLTLIMIHEYDSYKMIHANLTDIGYIPYVMFESQTKLFTNTLTNTVIN